MTTQPKRKRSGSLQLTTMLAGAASLSVSACDSSSPATGQWNQASVAQGEQVQSYQYATLDDCKSANEIPDEQCDAGYVNALKDNEKSAPRYDNQSTCEDVYGAGNCVPRGSQGGGSFFTPLLAGFVVGQMLNGGGSPYYRGTGLYRERDGGYATGWGGVINRDYATGRTTIGRQGVDPPEAVRQAPPKMQTRTSVVSRGGFGGGRSYGYGG